MMRPALLLFTFLLLQIVVHTEEDSIQKHETQKPSPPPGPAAPTAPPPPPPPVQPNSLVSLECLDQKYTRASCAKVFCPPWLRCIRGECVCKLPYQCPRLGPGVCGLNGRDYLSLCQAQAISCRDEQPVVSHYGKCEGVISEGQLKNSGDHEVVVMTTPKHRALICGTESWNMAAANVVCRQFKKNKRGAAAAETVEVKDLEVKAGWAWPGECMSVRCTGYESSLMECELYKPRKVGDYTLISAVTCYNEPKGGRCSEFTCVNRKCISWNSTCDGVDDCGDASDEMCCTDCSNGAYHCKSGVCLSPHAVRDQIRDCLGGEDEAAGANQKPSNTSKILSAGRENHRPEELEFNPKEAILNARKHIESQLHCGIPNMDYVHKTEKEMLRPRTKRVVGGQQALPTQIQWQVAIEDEGRIHCGGAYLGGCWVLTAAHCVRNKPKEFRIKFSLWSKVMLLTTSDTIPVKSIIIHHEYNSRTSQNDIALIQLQNLAHVKECLHPNPAVRSICVPWSPLQFLPNSTCTISGWGRGRQETDRVYTLNYANVNIIGNCSQYYKDRFYDGMECAGDLEGTVDACQGDSGGPLVCTDASGVSYVWGIVSWGEKCGVAGYPGVYTKVADYFEWIRLHTGWPEVTKYNH
ncbi:complement factor I [Trichomycterus rosablanca]|uniref:complement factor I n=1 Tax=Trichomycterus rosablanca TaxID=2290929 RepID=UPI002F3567E6